MLRSGQSKAWLDWCAAHPPPKVTFENNVLEYEILHPQVESDAHLDRLTIKRESDYFVVTVDLGWHWMQIKPATIKISDSVLEVFVAGHFEFEFSLMIGDVGEPWESHFFVWRGDYARRSFPRQVEPGPSSVLRMALDAWKAVY